MKLLISLPGIGRFLSVLIRWEADDIHRFPDAKHFVNYTGLGTFHVCIELSAGSWTANQARKQVA